MSKLDQRRKVAPRRKRNYALIVAGRELKQLFRAYSEGDELAFRRAAQAIIEEEESKQHLALARDLRRLVAGGAPGAAFAEGVQLPAPPMDREGEWALADIRHAERGFDDLVLSGPLVDRLQGLVEEFRRWQRTSYAVLSEVVAQLTEGSTERDATRLAMKAYRREGADRVFQHTIRGEVIDVALNVERADRVEIFLDRRLDLFRRHALDCHGVAGDLYGATGGS